MGYYKDLGMGTVAGFDELTGYPVDEYGHLLNPIDTEVEVAIGESLLNLTNPYGFLNFAIGNGDDFLCMDYSTIETSKGDFLIVDSTYNSESSGYIGSVSYDVYPINDDKEKINALKNVNLMLWTVGDGEAPHSKAGWNQDERYFLRAIARNLFPDKFSRCSERMIRFGGKIADGAIAELLKQE